VTPPLPDPIAAAIDLYAERSVACKSRNEAGPLAARTSLCALIAEVVAERDAYRAALIDVCNNATFGHCAGAVSKEFLLAVPAEAAANFARLRSQRDAATKRADGLAAELDELRTAWFGIAGGENSFPSDGGGDCIAQQRIAAWLADGANAQRDELLRAAKEAEALIDDLYGYAITDWAWKYGEEWMAQRDAFRAAIARAQSGQPAREGGAS
jgi:hypothetical protein